MFVFTYAEHDKHILASAFASLVGIPVGIASSTATIKICVVSQQLVNLRYNSIIKKKEKETRLNSFAR